MIEVGEYVRTNNGLLGKVNKIELKGSGIRYAGEFITDTIIQFNDGKVYERRVKDKDIVKHSKNLIDLIEVGDIVNNYIVLDVMEDLQTGEIHLEMQSSYPKEGSCAIYNDEIKTILTKEQYMQNCYKVERSEEC